MEHRLPWMLAGKPRTTHLIGMEVCGNMVQWHMPSPVVIEV